MRHVFMALVLTAGCAARGGGQSPAVGLPATWGGDGLPPPCCLILPVRDAAALLEPIRARNDVPALAAVVIDSKDTLWQGVCGVRRAGSSTPVTDNDKFHIGSNGKAITATLCATLVRDGVLKWDTSVADVLASREPDKNFKVAERWKNVTLAHLLTNSGGAPEDIDREFYKSLYEFKGTPTEARRALAGFILKNNPNYNPGDRYGYSNAGFALAGHMAEVAAGKAFEELVQERVFGPLWIESAGFGGPGTVGVLDQPRGHTRKGEPVEAGLLSDNPPAVAPAGTMHLSMSGWAKFVRAHLRAERGLSDGVRGTILLENEMYRTLHTPGAKGSDYAMGWLVTTRPQWAKGDDPNDTGRALTHTGSNTMWTATVWIAPEIDRAFLVACNTGAAAGSAAREEAMLALINADREARGKKPIKP